MVDNTDEDVGPAIRWLVSTTRRPPTPHEKGLLEAAEREGLVLISSNTGGAHHMFFDEPFESDDKGRLMSVLLTDAGKEFARTFGIAVE